jgi:MFS family permease
MATLGTFAFAGPIVLLALRASVIWVAAAAVVSGVGIAVFGVLWDTTLQQHIPSAVLSRVSAYDWLGSIALAPIGFVMAGTLADALGVSGALWLAAGWTVLASAAVLAVPSVRHLEAVPSQGPDRAPAALSSP